MPNNNPFGPRRNEVTIEPNRSGQMWPGGIDPQTNTPLNIDQGEQLRVDSQAMALGESQLVVDREVTSQHMVGGEEVVRVGQMEFDFGE